MGTKEERRIRGTGTGEGSDAPIAERAAFDIVRYASCWEDPALLAGAVPGPGADWLSIASGGDNAFALLAALQT